MQFNFEGDKCFVSSADGKRLTADFDYVAGLIPEVRKDVALAAQVRLAEAARDQAQESIRDHLAVMQAQEAVIKRACEMLDAFMPLARIALNYNGHMLPTMEPQAREELRVLIESCSQFSAIAQWEPPARIAKTL